MPDPLNNLLHFDPLAEAEQFTGNSHKDCDVTMALGVALSQVHAENMEAILMARGDTTFQNKMDRYLTIIESVGFEQVLNLPFNDLTYPGITDAFMVYARRDGLLLSFDTYRAEDLNGGHVYYNWRPTDGKIQRGCTSSGHFSRTDDVWIGDHDCREALIYNIDRLAANGEFVYPWIEQPFLWLLHHGDTKEEYNYETINAQRIAMLPAWVQKMIGA